MSVPAVKDSIRSLATLRASMIRRKHLRKYSWLPDVFRVKGSIVMHIIGPVLTVTLWAVLVTYVWSKGRKVMFPNSVLPLLSIVVGLVLVFRNSTSYDRFWEGRKLFGTLTSDVRNLSRNLWVSVALPPTTEQPLHIKGKTPTTDVTPSQLRGRKIEVLKLALSFVFATKHYLRSEDGTHWEDYADVFPAYFARRYDPPFVSLGTPVLPSYVATKDRPGSQPGAASPDALDATKRVRPKRSKPSTSGATTPLLESQNLSLNVDSSLSDSLTIPLPLIIAHEIAKAIFQFRREGFLETVGPAGANGMNQIVQSMVDKMTSMERVANTPIPSPYGIHLKQCVTLYLFSLPFTLISDLGWVTIPVVTVVAFTFMGIEGIADEIEMPFGYDTCDLPLDRYCLDLKEEVEFMIEKLPEGGQGMHGCDDGEGDD